MQTVNYPAVARIADTIEFAVCWTLAKASRPRVMKSASYGFNLISSRLFGSVSLLMRIINKTFSKGFTSPWSIVILISMGGERRFVKICQTRALSPSRTAGIANYV